MALIFDEQLETTPGSDEGLSGGGVDAGCTRDPDYATSNIGSPSGWGSECLQLAITAAGEDAYYQMVDVLADKAITYHRIEIYINSHSLSSGQKAFFYSASDNTGGKTAFYLYLINNSGNFQFTIRCYHNGSSNYYYSSNISTGTKYRIDVKWDATNDLWEWKVDGVSEDSGALTLTHATVIDTLVIGTYAGDNAVNYCLDNIQVDDADWVPGDVTAEDINANDVSSTGSTISVPILQPIRLTDAANVFASSQVTAPTLALAAIAVDANDLSSSSEITEPTIQPIRLVDSSNVQVPAVMANMSLNKIAWLQPTTCPF